MNARHLIETSFERDLDKYYTTLQPKEGDKVNLYNRFDTTKRIGPDGWHVLHVNNFTVIKTALGPDGVTGRTHFLFCTPDDVREIVKPLRTEASFEADLDTYDRISADEGDEVKVRGGGVSTVFKVLMIRGDKAYLRDCRRSPRSPLRWCERNRLVVVKKAGDTS